MVKNGQETNYLTNFDRYFVNKSASHFFTNQFYHQYHHILRTWVFMGLVYHVYHVHHYSDFNPFFAKSLNQSKSIHVK